MHNMEKQQEYSVYKYNHIAAPFLLLSQLKLDLNFSYTLDNIIAKKIISKHVFFHAIQTDLNSFLLADF